MCDSNCLSCFVLFFFFKQKTAYEMRISDWSSDVCSSDLASLSPPRRAAKATRVTALSLRIAAFADRRPKLLALLLGALSATGFAPLHLWPLTLMALAGWMALVARSPRGWRAAGVGWAFGFGHFAIGLNWKIGRAHV